MVGQGLLRSGLIVAMVSGVVLAPVSQVAACSSVELRAGNCAVRGRIIGQALDLDANRHTPGGRSNHDGGNRGGAGGALRNPNAPVDPNAPTRVCLLDPLRPPCRVVPRSRPRRAESGRPGVTIDDLVSFRPRPGSDHTQPAGWAVIGLDTNLYSTAASEVQHGSLLGKPARVRFTPVAWHWSYGDGSQETLSTAGAPWPAGGGGDFDQTATSHVYRAPGRYVVRLDIRFVAVFEWAGEGWRSVRGTIDAAADPLTIAVGTAKTVLVGRDCIADPSGPGC